MAATSSLTGLTSRSSSTPGFSRPARAASKALRRRVGSIQERDQMAPRHLSNRLLDNCRPVGPRRRKGPHRVQVAVGEALPIGELGPPVDGETVVGLGAPRLGGLPVEDEVSALRSMPSTALCVDRTTRG